MVVRILRESLVRGGSNITDWRVCFSQATIRQFCGVLDSAEGLTKNSQRKTGLSLTGV